MKPILTITDKQKIVVGRLESAARTLRRLPPVKVQGYFSTWPLIIREPIEIQMMEPELLRLRPSMKDITQLEEILFVWMRWLEVEERKIVWRRAERVPWKLICTEFGVGRTKAWEIYKCALGKIAVHL